MEREEKRGRKITFARLVDSGIFEVRTRALDSGKWKGCLTFVCPAVQRKMSWSPLFCFVFNKILVSVVDVPAVELHPTLQALPSSLKLTCLNTPGWGEHYPPDILYQNQVLTYRNKTGSHMLPFYAWPLPFCAATPCPPHPAFWCAGWGGACIACNI